MPRAGARRAPGRVVAAVLAVTSVTACSIGGSSGASTAVDRPRSSAVDPRPGTVATDACGLVTAEEAADAAKLPEVVVTARAVQWGDVREDFCGWGSPLSIGTYAVSLALRTGVTPKAFTAERAAADEPPRFSEVDLPADATPRDVAALGDAAWSRVVYTVSGKRATATAVEVQVRFDREVLAVVVPLPSGATPEIGPAVSLTRSAAQRVDLGFDVPRRETAPPCDAISLQVVRRALGATVQATRAVVHDDDQVQCWFEAGDGFLEVVARSSPDAVATFRTERGVRPAGLYQPGVLAHYVTTPHQNGSMLIGERVVTLRGLTAGEAKGRVPTKPAKAPSAADRALLLEVAAAFSG